MGEDDIHRVSDELRIELLRAAHELAAARVALTMRRWGVDLKYSQHQPRVPAGQREGGQWSGGHGGISARAKRARAVRKAAKALARAAVANPEAAAMAARAAGLPAAAGTLGVSRAGGLTSVIASGGAGQIGGEGMTPIVGIPFDLPVTSAGYSGSLTSAQRNEVIDQCIPEYNDLAAQCGKLPTNMRRQCYEEASDWLGDCVRRGNAALKPHH